MQKKITLALLATSLLTLGWGGQALAIPNLQLDIVGGIYMPETDPYDATNTGTTVAQSDSFTLQAFLISSTSTPLSSYYYISAAISPIVKTPTDLGTFSINGTPYDATGALTYGAPPLTDPKGATWDNGDLPKHSIFETYYTELKFKFDASAYIRAYDVADGTSQNKRMYYKEFNIDVSGLNPDYVVHFDLYSEATKCGDYDINKKAPFSHDAQSGGEAPVPEPATMLLLGTGLAGLAATARRKKNA